MKKAVSLALCAAILLSVCGIFASAKKDDIEYNGYPVILVPGYSSSFMYDTENGKQAWGLDFGKVGGMVLDSIIDLGISLGAMTVGNADKIAEYVGNGIIEMCAELPCNPDGSSVHPLERYYTSAEDMCYSAILERHPEGGYMSEPKIAAEIAKYTGYENIFNFTDDFRMGSEFCAEQLNDFIESVKEYTGSDKVNIIAISHGGQTVSTYLALHGDKADIQNATLAVPAIGGAGFAYDALMGDVHLDEDCIARFIEYGNNVEPDIEWLLKAGQLGFLDQICNKLIPYVLQVIGNWGSIWDFVPNEEYESAKKFRLDPEINAGLIETSDRYHYEIRPKVKEAFETCRANGMNINIIAGTGQPIVTGLNENSDGIITAVASTGATCAPLGKRFADGYTQVNDCGGKYKVSPSMTVDASTAYLPDNTWFVEGMFHGMMIYDSYAFEFMMRSLLDDKLTDVYADPAFPQFKDSAAASLGVYTEFTGCMPGYIDSGAESLKITNCSLKSNITVTSVTANGADLYFALTPKVLKPGDSMQVKFKGNLPEVDKKEVDITVTYLINTVTPACTRTQGYTIMNGDGAESNGGFADAGVTLLNKLIGPALTGILKKLGLNEFLSMIYAAVYFFFNSLKGMFVN